MQLQIDSKANTMPRFRLNERANRLSTPVTINIAADAVVFLHEIEEAQLAAATQSQMHA
jgi:hypothetical protein